jgi:hypothetical protein
MSPPRLYELREGRLTRCLQSLAAVDERIVEPALESNNDYEVIYLIARKGLGRRRAFPSCFRLLEHTGGYSPQQATPVPGTLLPDLLSYDPWGLASLLMAGHRDVFDSFLGILKNGKIIKDKVGPHSDLIAEFAYLDPPRSCVTKVSKKTTARQKSNSNDKETKNGKPKFTSNKHRGDTVGSALAHVLASHI